MAIIDSLGPVVATSIFIFLVTIDKGVVLGCSGGPEVLEPSSFNCSKYGEHPCDDEKGCYSEDQRCDGKNDCLDKSDEDHHHCGSLMIPITYLKNSEKN